MRFQKIRVGLKELDNKSLERNEVHLGVWVEEVEVDLNTPLLNKIQRTISKKKKTKDNRLWSTVPFVFFFMSLFSFWHCQLRSIKRGSSSVLTKEQDCGGLVSRILIKLILLSLV